MVFGGSFRCADEGMLMSDKKMEGLSRTVRSSACE